MRPYDFKQLNEEQAVADAKNAAIAFGGFGAALGLAMGLAGGLCSRSIPRAIVSGTVGLLVAGSLGAGVSYVLSPIYRKYQDPAATDLFLPLLIHATTWGALSAGAGLAFGLGVGGKHRVAKALIGGLIGAILGTVLFELIASILFPTDRTTQPISVTAHSRLLARILAGVVAALGAAWSIREIRHRPKS